MTVTVRDDDHNVVNSVRVQPSLHKTSRNLLLDVFKEGAEVTWAGQGGVQDTLLVSLEDFHSAFAARVFFAIEVPKPTHLVVVLLVEVVGNTAETVDIEAALEGVLAHDVADLEDGPFVLVHLSVFELSVERVGVLDLEVAQRKVDCD